MGINFVFSWVSGRECAFKPACPRFRSVLTMKETRRIRRKAFMRRLISKARHAGDTRPTSLIQKDLEDRHEQINLAFEEAHRDRERAETVSLNDYLKAQIWRGEVLTQARSYIHPVL